MNNIGEGLATTLNHALNRVQRARVVGDRVLHIVRSEVAPNERVSPDGTLRLSGAEDGVEADTSDLIDQYMVNRLHFVRTIMGWLPDIEDDHDRYDEDPATIYALRSSAKDTSVFYAGARYTRSSVLEGSLTWEMMRANRSMAQQARLNEREYASLVDAAASGDLWDLTRWLPAVIGARPGPRALQDSMLDVMGAGMALTAENGQTPTWFYFASSKMKSFLDKLGIASTVLVGGEVTPGDSDSSYLCVVRPVQALEELQNSDSAMGQYAYSRVVAAAESIPH